MTWAAGTLYGFDTETTGVDVHTDRIVTATVVKLVDGQVADHRSWIINPGIEIPAGATKVHGITTDHAREHGMETMLGIADVADTVTAVLRSGLPLVAFNAAYDFSILEAECRRHQLPGLLGAPFTSVIDPFVLGKGLDHLVHRRKVDPKTKRKLLHKLPLLCERYKVPFTESHDSTADAVGAVRLAQAIAAKEPHIAGMGPNALHTLQVTWRKKLQNDQRAEWDANGWRHDGMDAGWPLHSRLEAAMAR